MAQTGGGTVGEGQQYPDILRTLSGQANLQGHLRQQR